MKAQTEHESREQPSQAAHVRNDVKLPVRNDDKLPSVPQDAKLPLDQGLSLASLIPQTPKVVPQDVKLRPELGLSSPISAEEKSGQAPPLKESHQAPVGKELPIPRKALRPLAASKLTAESWVRKDVKLPPGSCAPAPMGTEPLPIPGAEIGKPQGGPRAAPKKKKKKTRGKGLSIQDLKSMEKAVAGIGSFPPIIGEGMLDRRKRAVNTEGVHPVVPPEEAPEV